MLSTSPSNTSCFGVSPLPVVVPIWPMNVSVLLARHLASKFTYEVSENAPGRLIWSTIAYCAPGTLGHTAEVSVPLRTVYDDGMRFAPMMWLPHIIQLRL